MAVEAEGLRVERPRPGVATLVLSRPDCLNALSPEMAAALPERLASLDADPDVRAIVLTGDGRAFSSGADLSVLGGTLPAGSLEHAFSAVTNIASSDTPVIAAIHGPAIGGAFGIALACDLRLASPSASFAATFIEMGLVPDYGLSHSLPRIAGEAAALEILLTARRVEAEEALALGLVQRICEDPLAEALALGEAIVARAPRAVAETKRLVRGAHATTLAAQLGSEARDQAAALQGLDFEALFPGWRERILGR